MYYRNLLFGLACALWLFMLEGCRVARYTQEGEAIVSRTKIMMDGAPSKESGLQVALLQRPYRRTFGFLPVAVWIWHPATDSPWHKLRHKLGTAPTQYDSIKTARTAVALTRLMNRKGYLEAKVDYHTTVRHHKATVQYDIYAGQPRVVNLLQYTSADTALSRFLTADAPRRLLHPNTRLDIGVIEQERSRLTSRLREQGYYDFNKEDVSFVADTSATTYDVDLTCSLTPNHQPWRIRKIHFVADHTAGSDTALTARPLYAEGFDVTPASRIFLKDKVLIRSCHVLPGHLYSEKNVQDTYVAFSRLPLLRYVNIRMEPVDNQSHLLDCYIQISPTATHSVQVEVDGTHTAGDLGGNVGLTYQHRNIFHGSEVLTARLKGGYEALSADISNVINKNYREYNAEVNLNFPQIICPFLSDSTRRQSRASTSVRLGFSQQFRPEYDRNVATGAFTYQWKSPTSTARHSWDVLSLNYVYLPNRSESLTSFLNSLSPITRSSYTDHFILSTAYTVRLGNATATTGRQYFSGSNLWSLRLSAEVAGNLLTAYSHLIEHEKNSTGRHIIFDQPYEQYSSFDADWSLCHTLTNRSKVALHAAGGVALPYGNSDVLPFEKRYYAGGANSVRGWSVRRLGPGHYASDGATFNYINHCGDIHLDASVELRTFLFWKLESALFIDAGNVWTINDYDDQKGGQFTSKFYRDIATSWGAGLRLITDFVILRLDWGVKAYDPAENATRHWRIAHPFQSDNSTFHFAVGYPF